MNKEKNCNNDAGKVAPIINRERCEGKAACFNVCPFDVFEIAKISKEERNKLSLRGKLKAWVHGGKQAFVYLNSIRLVLSFAFNERNNNSNESQHKKNNHHHHGSL